MRKNSNVKIQHYKPFQRVWPTVMVAQQLVDLLAREHCSDRSVRNDG